MIHVGGQITDEVLNHNRHSQTDSSCTGTGDTCQTSNRHNRRHNGVAHRIYQHSTQRSIGRNRLHHRSESHNGCRIEQGRDTAHGSVRHHGPELGHIKAWEEADKGHQNPNQQGYGYRKLYHVEHSNQDHHGNDSNDPAGALGRVLCRPLGHHLLIGLCQLVMLSVLLAAVCVPVYKSSHNHNLKKSEDREPAMRSGLHPGP